MLPTCLFTECFFQCFYVFIQCQRNFVKDSGRVAFDTEAHKLLSLLVCAHVFMPNRKLLGRIPVTVDQNDRMCCVTCFDFLLDKAKEAI